MNETVVIIPARYASTRFPGKVLADLAGKPVIRHVYERVVSAERVHRTVVATDDYRVADAVVSFGGEVVMTSPKHTSGTDRIAEAARITGGDIIVNVQGDEPLIEPGLIDMVVDRIREDKDIVCSTAASPIRDEKIYSNPNAVKVVTDLRDRALYFSRSPLPYYRDGGFGGAYLHVGIYCFRREFLETYTSLEPSALESAEKLEQLRMLENGYRIGVVFTDTVPKGVDTKEDLDTLRKMLGAPDS